MSTLGFEIELRSHISRCIRKPAKQHVTETEFWNSSPCLCMLTLYCTSYKIKFFYIPYLPPYKLIVETNKAE